ncbi:MAG: class I SAM-dependent methyltransferase [Hyphomicrobiales bacterium]|nr:class I SAM-dependent methyltransferase [Hyphomicrobiales bacterium]MCP5370187.1 class I SAM-dependent methyltransferase [Hyphomicrobiales bacterium]
MGDAREDDAVRLQYETYPYPERDPADEARRLVVGSPSHLLEMNHYVFAGRRDFAAPFRALVAGGGTGDAAIMLAQQLADAGPGRVEGRVDYVDLSQASRAVAEARARARGLTNIAFHSLAIEDLPDSGLGPFDYVDCCGVLHHLADPAAGLRALAAVLADDGGMGLMLYGEYGRTGVYPVQDLLRRLGGDDPPAERVALARRLLADLPATNWLRRNPGLGDHLDGGDAGLYDLLLHPRDRAYRVMEVADLAAAAGLRLTAFVDPLRYDPEALVTDPRLRRRLAALPWIARCAAAEALAGNLRKHVFYLVKAGHPGPAVADPADGAAVPCWHQVDAAALVAGMGSGQPLSAQVDGLTLRAPLPPLAKAIAGRIDGHRPIAAIEAQVRDLNPALDAAAFARQFAELFRAFNGFGKLFLRVPPAP